MSPLQEIAPAFIDCQGLASCSSYVFNVSPALLGDEFTKSRDLAWFVLQPPEYPLQCMLCMFSETFKSSSRGLVEAAHKQILSQEMQLEGRGTFSWSWAPRHSCPPHDAAMEKPL